MYASENGHTATVEVLLGAGADKEARNVVRYGKIENHTHPHIFSLCERAHQEAPHVRRIPVVLSYVALPSWRDVEEASLPLRLSMNLSVHWCGLAHILFSLFYPSIYFPVIRKSRIRVPRFKKCHLHSWNTVFVAFSLWLVFVCACCCHMCIFTHSVARRPWTSPNQMTTLLWSPFLGIAKQYN